jgi:hypothetical protein
MSSKRAGESLLIVGCGQAAKAEPGLELRQYVEMSRTIVETPITSPSR